MFFALFLLAALTAQAAKPEFQAGVARVDITPEGPIWLSGYAVRTRPSDGIATRLHAKALAIEDKKRYRIVIVTTDLIGLPRAITDTVAARVEKQHRLRRAQLVFNSSHTHAGPVVWPNLSTMYFFEDEQRKRLEAYAQKLTADLAGVIDAALTGLEPAEIRFGQGKAGFAWNRRQKEKGPVDHSVPVLDVRTPDGKRKAVLFGYACHNTTLGGEYYQVNGDYAGYAQTAFEEKNPGVTALFLLLCGADQNPNPRGAEAHAIDYGRQLAESVTAVLAGEMKSLKSPVKSAYQTIDLAFVPHTREQFETEAGDSNRYKAARARLMLRHYDEGGPIRSTPYPVQVIHFAPDVTLIALGGEVVVDYARRAKGEFPGDLIVAGYSNDVMCYIPSLRVLREGGYEGDSSMMYYGQPGQFTEDVEEDIFRALRQLMRRAGAL
jgi:hypothetical protein